MYYLPDKVRIYSSFYEKAILKVIPKNMYHREDIMPIIKKITDENRQKLRDADGDIELYDITVKFLTKNKHRLGIYNIYLGGE